MITENPTIAPASEGMDAGVRAKQWFAGPNETRVEFPREKCIHQFFEEQVRRVPGKAALIFADERLTYAELNERADSLAAKLRSCGIQPDVPIGICVHRSLDMVVGLLAILKAGGCYFRLVPT
jgi:non-ribosomal peptide synthetase component F